MLYFTLQLYAHIIEQKKTIIRYHLLVEAPKPMKLRTPRRVFRMDLNHLMA